MICTLIPFSPVGSSLLKEPTPKLAPKPKKRPEPVSGAFFWFRTGVFDKHRKSKWQQDMEFQSVPKVFQSENGWEWPKMPFWWILLVLMSLMSDMAPCDFFWPFITIGSVDACRRCNVPLLGNFSKTGEFTCAISLDLVQDDPILGWSQNVETSFGDSTSKPWWCQVDALQSRKRKGLPGWRLGLCC